MALSSTLTNTAFIMNFINMCIGLGLLAKPYALVISGWYSMISVCMAFSIITYTGYLTAKVTVKAFNISANEEIIDYEVVNIDSETVVGTDSSDSDEEDRVKHTEESQKNPFQLMGYKALGKCGEYYVNTVVITMMLLFNINVLIIEWELLTQITDFAFMSHDIPFFMKEECIFIYLILFMSPIIFVLNWKQLTFVSLISVISVTLIIVTILIIYILSLYQFGDGGVPSTYTSDESFTVKTQTAQYAVDNMTSISRVFFSFLIFKTGMAASMGIPFLILSLKDKRRININRLIVISYLIVTIFSVLFGVFGAEVYRSKVSVLILNNLFIWPGTIVVVFISIIKVLNLWSSYGVFLSIVSSVFEGMMNVKDTNRNKRYLIRLFVVLTTALVAFICRYHLAFVTAIQAAINSIFGDALVLPLVLYIAMFHRKMSFVSKLIHGVLLLFVIGSGFFVLFDSKNFTL